MKLKLYLTFVGVLLSALMAGQLMAQSTAASLRGQVTDPSGAAVPGATVTVSGVSGRIASGKTNSHGNYRIKGLTPGTYSVRAAAPNFSTVEVPNITLEAGRERKLDLSLKIEQQVQHVTVSAQATQLSLNSANNASAVVISGKALQSLSDDPDELQAELEALAGPAAGPNGGQIYIDGFTGGQLPPKSDILEIHVNQNPFSAEYDKVGYGRIEIITKPGTSQYHGGFFADGNDSIFNTRNPFVTTEPAYHSDFFNGNVGGPLGKNASFFVDAFHRGINASSIVNASVPNSSLTAAVPFAEAVLNPQSRTLFTPRVDYQIGSKNVLVARYFMWRDSAVNSGIGQFVLPSQAYNTSGQENALELSDTQILSARTVNQTRFEYRRESSSQIPQSLAPSLDVLGAFNGGGSGEGKQIDHMNYIEGQDIATMTFGKHTVVYGGRVRDYQDSNTASSNFNGTFMFPNIADYITTEQGLAAGLPLSQIQAEGHGPTQFSITTGNPLARVNLADAGFYAEDQWRARRNLSLDLGVRFETQNFINDHADFAPRIGLAWGLGRGNSRKTVLRAGFGLFYDRFEEQQALQSERLNGLNEQQYLVTNPNFYPTIPSINTLSALSTATAPTIYTIDPGLRAPYSIQSAIGLERQVTKSMTASVTYLNSHGLHQFMTRNINTPLPGEYDPANPSANRPFGNVSACGVISIPTCAEGFTGNIYQYESNGLYNQNEIISNFRYNANIVSLFGYYTLNFADSNTNGIGTFPSDPYNIGLDYGRAIFDVRNRFVVGGAINLPLGFRLMPFVIANSGRPYNITLGRDLLGTSQFNQRPALVAPGTTGPNIVATPLGTFNIDPTLGEPVIPVNWLTGPGSFSFNFHFEKIFGFGKKEEHGGGGGGGFYHHSHGLGGRGLSGGGGGHSFWGGSSDSKYTLALGISVHNAFNNVNLGQPIGNIGSPYFGQSTSLAGGPFSSQAANRRIDFQIRFNF